MRLQSITKAPMETQLVIGGCHSVFLSEDSLKGDPMEVASLHSIGWSVENNICKPLTTDNNATFSNNSSLCITHRFHFSSTLQCMTVIAKFTDKLKGSSKYYSLVKGSPEKIDSLLLQSLKPCWYEQSHRLLEKKGLRIIALAFKEIEQSQIDLMMSDRNEAEKNLRFAGFLTFNCKIRNDTKEVIIELLESDHRVLMITGDSLFTAIHVASEVGILRNEKSNILYLDWTYFVSKFSFRFKNDRNEQFDWKVFETDQSLKFSLEEIKELSQKYSLCIDGFTLERVLVKHPQLKSELHRIGVFARMKPDQKERLIEWLKASGHSTLMCGDGTNDIGALKASDVGIALLSGFGDTNVLKTEDEKLEIKKDDCFSIQQMAWINDPTVTSTVKRQRIDYLNQMKIIEKDVRIRKERGEWFPELKAKFEYSRKKQIEAMENRIKQNNLSKEGKKESLSITEFFSSLQTNTSNDGKKNEDELELVKLGDASIAAPFTSKMPSIRSVIDIIRQGRCTLLTKIQTYQILALTCLISSYSLSVLYLEGIKFGEKQMTFTGILSIMCFLCISRAQPLPKLSPLRPPQSIFHPSLFVSLLGQFAIHLFVLRHLFQYSKSNLPIDFVLHKNNKFQANLINTVIFLTSSVQQISVFAVNYKGRPFMKNITENPFFTISLLLSAFGTFVLATESIPFINRWIALVPLNNGIVRFHVLSVLGLDILFSFLWYFNASFEFQDIVRDRLSVAVFHREMIQYMSFTKEDWKRLFKLVGCPSENRSYCLSRSSCP